MRKLTFIYLFLLSFVSFSQNLGNPAVIGQSSRNQKVGKGFQIEDTLLVKGKVRFSVVSVGSTKDTFVTVVDTAGYFSKIGQSTFLSGGGGTLQTLSVGTNTLTISGGNTVDLNRKVDSLYLNTTNDSTIYLINGTRHAIPRGALTFAKNSAGDSIVLTVSGVRTAVKDSIGSITPTSTTTFTNKRITARVDSTTSSATPTINTDNVDTYKLTAQAADITSFTTNLSGTPTDDQILHIVIIGTSTRLITWGSSFEASTVALPTTTVSTDRLDVYFVWNTATSKWRCGGVW